MPVEESGLMAAVDAGIAEASSAPAPAAPTPPPEGNDDAPETGASSEESAQSADGAGDGAGEEGAPAVAGGDEPADGVGASGDGVPADGDKPDADKVAKEGDPAAPVEVKPKDPINDPLPNALKKETKERIQTLVSLVKENTSKLEQVTRTRDEIFNAITETRATPEQYGQALSYLRKVNSPDRSDREEALAFMQQEVAALARMLGKPVPGVNMLEGHSDLIEEVSTGRLSPERAQEIAASRHAASFERERGAINHQRTQQEQQQNQVRAAGVRDLNTLEAQLRAADPVTYAAKRKVLIESLKPVFVQIHPSQWAATFKRAYDALPAPARVVPPPPSRPGATPASGGGNTPLRASNPAGAARPAPSSLLDAINQGISEAR